MSVSPSVSPARPVRRYENTSALSQPPKITSYATEMRAGRGLESTSTLRAVKSGTPAAENAASSALL